MRVLMESRLASHAPPPAAVRPVAGVRLDGVVGRTLDPDHRQDDNGCRLARRVDVAAATQAGRLVGKPDDFAHCQPLNRAPITWPDATRRLRDRKVNGPLMPTH